ncbi:MAG TPA: hypothetical protein VF364_12255, partial [Candidatus Limnocylindria bacterium]
LAGVAAFPATTLQARVDAASTPVARPDGLADATWAVLARALASDPSDRYADGAAMAADLHRLPGVPAPAEVSPDSSAPTELIAIPVAASVALSAELPAIEPPAAIEPPLAPEPRAASAPPPPALRRWASRGTLAMAGIVGALTLALVVGMATASSPNTDPNAAAGTESHSPAPEATSTPDPEDVAEQPVDGAKPDKDGGKGKGKGKGGD